MVHHKVTISIIMVMVLAIITGGLFILTSKDLQAAGAINYKVTVRNPTSSKAEVQLWVSKIAASKHGQPVVIQAGGSYTWETGAICPAGFSGKYWDGDSKQWRKMRNTSCLGNTTTSMDTQVWTSSCCWSPINFEVCRKAGSQYSDIRDNDFALCKK